jgi:hypothetical protein
MNERNLSEVQKNTELPEIYFHAPNFRLDGVISTAKRSDAHLRPQIGMHSSIFASNAGVEARMYTKSGIPKTASKGIRRMTSTECQP